MRMPEKAKKGAIEAIFLRLLMHVIRQLRSIWLEEEVVEEEKGQEGENCLDDLFRYLFGLFKVLLELKK